MGALLRGFISSALTLVLLAWLVPAVQFSNWVALAVAALVLLFLQSIVKPTLKVLFLPVTFVTFGLFSVVINVLIIWLATFLVPGFVVRDIVLLGIPLNHFLSLLTISMLIGLIQSFIRIFIK